MAIIIKNGFESRNQECTIALVESLNDEKKISISQDIINALKSVDQDSHIRSTIELRENFQYGTETSLADDKMKTLKELGKKALDETKNIIYS